MEHFLLCCNGILPILLLMLLGYGLRRLHVLDAGAFAALDRLCFRVLIPAMLFVSVYNADFSTAFQPSAMAFVVLAVVGNFLLVFLLVPRWIPAPADAASTVHGLCHTNMAALGIPLIVNLFGQSQLAVYSILMAFASPLVNVLMVFEHLYFQGDRVKLGKLARNVFTSPYLVGTLAGIACKVLGLHFPTFAESALTSLQSAATPMCLIALGGSFTFRSIRGQAGRVTAIVLSRCVGIPAVVLGIAVALGFRRIVLASLLVLFCCPSAAATYSFSTGYCGNPTLASQIVVYTTAVSLFTIFLWLFAFLQLGLL